MGSAITLMVVYLSLIPALPSSGASQSDKVMHMLAYATLMSWFANLWALTSARIKTAIGLVALGITLEFVQRWTGYRTFDVADMFANTAGVLTGWLLAPPRMPNYLRALETLLPE